MDSVPPRPDVAPIPPKPQTIGEALIELSQLPDEERHEAAGELARRLLGK